MPELPDVESFRRYIAEHGLGPDALMVSWRAFRQIVKKRRGSLKAFLMDQRALAGVGNLYADEILFQARLHPLAHTAGLPEPTVRSLYATLRRVLRTAI